MTLYWYQFNYRSFSLIPEQFSAWREKKQTFLGLSFSFLGAAGVKVVQAADELPVAALFLSSEMDGS